MANKQVYIVRHGQTDYNLRGIVQGSGINAPLNDLGRAQAEAFYKHFNHVPFNKVYLSHLLRTEQSVAKFLDKSPYEKHQGLNEISWGIYEGVEISLEDKVIFKELTDKWAEGLLDEALEKGESPNKVALRQRNFLPKLIENVHEEQVLICMHGRALRIFLCVLLNLPLSQMSMFPHQNLGLYHLELEANGKFKMLKENYIEHLNYL